MSEEFERRLALAGLRPGPDEVLAFWRWDTRLLLGEEAEAFLRLVDPCQDLQLLCEPGVYPSARLHPLVFLLRDIFLHFHRPPAEAPVPLTAEQALALREVEIAARSALLAFGFPVAVLEAPKAARQGRRRPPLLGLEPFWQFGPPEAMLALLAEVVRARGRPLKRRQTYCRNACRAKANRRKQAERERRVRDYLQTAGEALDAAIGVLRKGGNR